MEFEKHNPKNKRRRSRHSSTTHVTIQHNLGISFTYKISTIHFPNLGTITLIQLISVLLSDLSLFFNSLPFLPFSSVFHRLKLRANESAVDLFIPLFTFITEAKVSAVVHHDRHYSFLLCNGILAILGAAASGIANRNRLSFKKAASRSLSNNLLGTDPSNSLKN
ncbi:hypothetical protein HanRHA438_Chr01g0003911 [Helianthus annuus]|nr:hypothetical protein HanRHA438_Chr01g0003911 [Helianthus annuus]